jgi:hypothetical protein
MFYLSMLMLHTGEMERVQSGKKVQIRASTEKNTQDEQSHERSDAFTQLSSPQLTIVALVVV